MTTSKPETKQESARHDWDDQDKCPGIGCTDQGCPAHYATAHQPAPDVTALVEALEGVFQYGADTLSGRMGMPPDKEWYLDAVRVMVLRAKNALAAYRNGGDKHTMGMVGRPPAFRSSKNGHDWPTLGEKYIVRLNGVLQEDIYAFDQGDDGAYGMGEYFWYRDDLDECPLFDSENDEWLPLSALAAYRNGGES